MANFSSVNLDDFGGSSAVALSAAGAVVALVVTAYLASSASSRKSGKHIPGPAGWPLVGNALQFVTKNEWLQFDGWAKEYGA